MYHIKYVSSNVFSQKEFSAVAFHDAAGELLHWTAKDMFSNLPFREISELTEEITGALQCVGTYSVPDHVEVKFDTPVYWVRIDISYTK